MMLSYNLLKLQKTKPIASTIIFLKSIINKLIDQLRNIGSLHRVVMIVDIECYLAVDGEGGVVG